MAGLEERYNKALEYIKNPPADAPPIDMDNTQRLTFYAIFRQIKDGACKGPQPSRLKVVERAKYDAWKALGKMTKEDSMKKYITELNKLAPGWEKPTPKL